MTPLRDPSRARTVRRRRLGALVALAALLAVLGGALAAPGGDDPAPRDRDAAARPGPGGVPAPATRPPGGPPLDPYGSAPAPTERRVQVRFGRRPPRAALLWDVATGEVLYARRAFDRRRIASLTKMMTAVLAADLLPRRASVRITREAVAVGGSKVGLFRVGRRIASETMLYGLMLASGNDAALALAHEAAGSTRRFVRLMNRRARELGLACTAFSTPHGLQDAGNASCARDLAVLAREVLARPRLRRVVGTAVVRRGFPVRGGRLELVNHNPLLRSGFPGTTGVKTGFTDAAGRCLVATARRGERELGVVILDDPRADARARDLLRRGFRA